MTGKFGWEGFAFGFGPRAWGFRRTTGGGRRQWFGAGDMKYVILKLLRDKPHHGYEVMKELEERMHGCYSPSPGTRSEERRVGKECRSRCSRARRQDTDPRSTPR